MILVRYFRDEVVERLRDEPDATFAAIKKPRDEILTDNDIIDRLWGLYQKAIEEYRSSPEDAFEDAMHDVFPGVTFTTVH